MKNSIKNKVLWFLVISSLLIVISYIILEITSYTTGLDTVCNPFLNVFIVYTFPLTLSVISYKFLRSRKYLLNAYDELEEKQKETDELIKELSEYKFALDQSAMISIIDKFGKFKRVNKSFLELTGFKKEEIIGRSVWRVPSSLCKEGVFKIVKDIADKGSVWRGEIEYYRANGTIRYTSAVVVPLSKKKEGNNECLVIQYDITQEKNNELALKRSERQKDLILANAQTIIFTHDANGFLKSVNRLGAQILDVLPEEIVGSSISTFIKDPGGFYKYLNDINTIGYSEGYLKIISKKKDDQILYYKSVLYKDQEEQYVIGSAIDITKTLEVENELKSQKNFTTNLLDESPNLVCVLDEQKNIAYLNRKFKTVFNIPLNTNIRNVKELLNYTSEASALINNDKENFEDRERYCVFECKIQKPGIGSETSYFKVQKSLFLNETQKKLELIIATDITEKQLTEVALLKANSIIQNSLRMKDQFISNMSHEIRTPLNAIIGFTELLSTTNLDEGQLDHVDTVKTAGQNLLAIINDILDLSKIEAGKITLASTPFNLPNCITNIKKLFEHRAAEKGIYVKTNIAPGVQSVLCGDEVRLNQILINFVSNACKFTSKGGIDILVEQIPQAQKNKVFIRFVIKDSGIGIERDKLDVIFERYSQASEDIHKKYGGTGLGLSISLNLIELFGGEMKIESEVGKGSVFSFIVPFDLPDKNIIEPKVVKLTDAPVFTSENPVTILLAEDNNTNAKLAMQILKRQNFIVDRVADGIDVMPALDKKHYDLILMDVQMEVQGGIETTKLIRLSNASYRDIPIIALTAHSYKGERNLCTEAGMDSYIPKPFTPDTLFKTINKTLLNKVGSYASENA